MIAKFERNAVCRIRLALAMGAILGGGAFAQAPMEKAPTETVRWLAAVTSQTAVQSGGHTAVELTADVREGWHVYALTQLPGGPTPLRVTVDDNEVAHTAGAPAGTVPEKRHDPAFELETQFYTHSFVLHVPIRVSRAIVGRRLIPVSVHFQTCSDRECLPPGTVHLSVPIDVHADSQVVRERVVSDD